MELSRSLGMSASASQNRFKTDFEISSPKCAKVLKSAQSYGTLVPVKITVILLPEEFKRFDAYCQQQGFKKSPLIARLIRDHLASVGFSSQSEPALSATSQKHQEKLRVSFA